MASRNLLGHLPATWWKPIVGVGFLASLIFMVIGIPVDSRSQSHPPISELDLFSYISELNDKNFFNSVATGLESEKSRAERDLLQDQALLTITEKLYRRRVVSDQQLEDSQLPVIEDKYNVKLRELEIDEARSGVKIKILLSEKILGIHHSAESYKAEFVRLWQTRCKIRSLQVENFSKRLLIHKKQYKRTTLLHRRSNASDEELTQATKIYNEALTDVEQAKAYKAACEVALKEMEAVATNLISH